VLDPEEGVKAVEQTEQLSDETVPHQAAPDNKASGENSSMTNITSEEKREKVVKARELPKVIYFKTMFEV
jgi:hypothetical protein